MTNLGPILNLWSTSSYQLPKFEVGTFKTLCPQLKSIFKRNIILARICAQSYIDEYVLLRDEVRRLEHHRRKADEQGVSVFFLDAKIQEAIKYRDKAHDQLILAGSLLAGHLDAWQTCGATRDELYDLCSCSKTTIALVEKDIRENNDREMSFSQLIWLYNLDDDKSSLPFLDMSVPAPLTHAVKEYMIFELHKAIQERPEVKRSMRNKLFELWPELQESALYEARDCEGNVVLLDNDSEVVSVIEEAQPLNEQGHALMLNILNAVYCPSSLPQRPALVRGIHKLFDTLVSRGIANQADLEESLMDGTEDNFECFLDFICPRFIAQNELLNIFEAELANA